MKAGTDVEPEEQTTLSGLDHREEPAAEVEPVAPEEVRAEAVAVEPIVPNETPSEELPREPESLPPADIELNGNEKAPETAEEPGLTSEESAIEPAPEEAAAAAKKEGEADAPRGFLSRLFGKGVDY